MIQQDSEEKVVLAGTYAGIVEAVNSLGNEHFASEADIIALRNRAAFEDLSWEMSGWTRGMRLVPTDDRPRLVARDSVLLDETIAEKAIIENREGKSYYPGETVYNTHLEIANTDKSKLPENRRVLLIPQAKMIPITSGDSEILRFLARDRTEAQTYFSRLQEPGIESLGLYLPKSGVEERENDVYVQQSWIHNLLGHSTFTGSNSNLFKRDYAFGVF